MNPLLDLERQSFGPLRLNASLEDASVFGPPKRKRGSAGNQVLEYAGGYQLEFQGGRLICVKFDIDEGVTADVVGDIRLSRATKPLDVQVWFGEPASDSTSGDLRWIDFERDTATLALEFDANGLSCVQLYGEGYA
jgi:hypothetical protein